jgi:TRAP-type mannitol/chloroaromatic compound transport system permease small subunit
MYNKQQRRKYMWISIIGTIIFLILAMIIWAVMECAEKPEDYNRSIVITHKQRKSTDENDA